MKIAIVIGHNAASQGAVRVTDGRSEYYWNFDLAEMIHALNPAQVRIFRRMPSASVGVEIRKAYEAVDQWGADVSCELHFNASTSQTSTGTETLYATNAGKVVALEVQAAMVRALGLRDRGLLYRRSGHGSLSLLAGKAPAVLVEPYFGSNQHDCAVADLRRESLALAIFEALGGTTSVLPVEPLPDLPLPTTITERLASLEARVEALEARA